MFVFNESVQYLSDFFEVTQWQTLLVVLWGHTVTDTAQQPLPTFLLLAGPISYHRTQQVYPQTSILLVFSTFIEAMMWLNPGHWDGRDFAPRALGKSFLYKLKPKPNQTKQKQIYTRGPSLLHWVWLGLHMLQRSVMAAVWVRAPGTKYWLYQRGNTYIYRVAAWQHCEATLVPELRKLWTSCYMRQYIPYYLSYF